MYKCSACGSEDKLVYGLANTSFSGGPKRIYITFCASCNKYYFYESLTRKLDENFAGKIELTKEEAMELIVKMKSCNDPKDMECKCNVHRYINSFKITNLHRMIAS